LQYIAPFGKCKWVKKTINDKYFIIFTYNGYRELFPKIIALETRKPAMENFTAEAFIKPIEDASEYLNGNGQPCDCGN
jgi:hypothetical protein